MGLHRGVVRRYDAGNHRADVLLVGSMSRMVLGIPVADDVSAELMTEGAACGVMFFAEGGTGVVVCTFDGVPVAVLDLDAWGPAMGIYDVLGGHHDDFFGQALGAGYATEVSGGSVELRDSEHGGVVRLRANAGVGNWARLWLGDAAGGYDTLDADEGWLMLFRGRHADWTSTTMLFGANDATTSSDRIWAANISGTWRLRCTSGGATTTVDSGISVDGDRYRHALEVYPTASGHQVDYWLDGVLIASCTSDVPAVPLTPMLYVYSNDDGESKTMYCNYWAVVPRFLG